MPFGNWFPPGPPAARQGFAFLRVSLKKIANYGCTFLPLVQLAQAVIATKSQLLTQPTMTEKKLSTLTSEFGAEKLKLVHLLLILSDLHCLEPFWRIIKSSILPKGDFHTIPLKGCYWIFSSENDTTLHQHVEYNVKHQVILNFTRIS